MTVQINVTFDCRGIWHFNQSEPALILLGSCLSAFLQRYKYVFSQMTNRNKASVSVNNHQSKTIAGILSVQRKTAFVV